MDAAMAQQQVLPREAQGRFPRLVRYRRRPGVLWRQLHLSAISSRCQRSGGAGVTTNLAQHSLDSRRDMGTSRTRSPGSNCGLPA